MTLQVKILLSYLALGGGAGGIYLGANGGFGNSATEGVVEISESNSNPQLVVAETSSQEPAVPVEKPQDVEVPVTGEKKEILDKAEESLEANTNEKAEEVLTKDEKTKQTKALNNNEETETKPVLELQTAEKAPAPQPQELRADMASPTPPKETKESVRSNSIKGPVSEQPTTKTEQKIDKHSLGPKETNCNDQSNQKGKGAFAETISLFGNGLYGIEWINCYAKNIQSRNNN